MAEIFGATASAIGLAPVALQIVQLALELKTYCQEVKRAPEDLLALVDEINDLANIIERIAALQLPEMVLQSCALHCNRTRERIEKVLKRLQESMAKSKRRARLAFPFHKSEMQDILKDLERGKTSLQLALQISTIAAVKSIATAQQVHIQHPQALPVSQRVALGSNFQELSSFVQNNHTPRDECMTTTIPNDAVVQRTRKRKSISRRPKPPSSSRSLGKSQRTVDQTRVNPVISHLWNGCAALSLQGWTRCFKVHNILYPGSQAVLFCWTGNLDALSRMLYDREVGRDDQDQLGSSLFAHACAYNQLHVARYLRSIGATCNSGNSETDTSPMSTYLRCPYSQGLEIDRKILDFLYEDCDIDAGPNQFFVDAVRRPPEQWDVFDLEELAFEMLRFPRFLTLVPSMITHELWLELWDLHPQGEHLESLWDAAIVAILGPPINYVGESSPYQIAKQIFSATATNFYGNARRVNGSRRLPHTCYFNLRNLLQDTHSIYPRSDNTDRLLRQWIISLWHAGVDLQVYGEDEARTWHLRHEDEEFDENAPHIYGFAYGPQVTDWRLFEEQAGDCYAGIFWDMVEHPERNIPGAFSEPEDPLWDDLYFDRIRNTTFTRRHLRYRAMKDYDRFHNTADDNNGAADFQNLIS